MTQAQRFPLVDGRCPVCDTVVEHEVDGVRVRFMPHDDPDWCRAAAQHNAAMLRRVIQQQGEDLGITKYREGFYRQAFGVALRELAANAEPHESPDHWRRYIEHRVRQEMGAADVAPNDRRCHTRCHRIGTTPGHSRHVQYTACTEPHRGELRAILDENRSDFDSAQGRN